MFKCPNCGGKLSKKYLTVEKSEYKPRWYEVYYDSAPRYTCAHCGMQLEYEGQVILIIAVFVEILLTGLIIYIFNIPRFLMAIIVVGVFFVLLKTIIRVKIKEPS